MEQLLAYFATFDGDLRLETVLADLLENGASLDDVRVQPTGLGRRRFDRDVASIHFENDGDRRTLRINVNREGLYDALPEGLFHQPTSRKPSPGKKATLDEMRAQRKKERAARTFFLPLEQEFFRARVWVESRERALGQLYQADSAPLWDLPACLDARQQLLATCLLPMAHLLAADLRLAEVCLRSFLGEDVRILPHPPAEEDTAEEVCLAAACLGTDLVLGGLVSDCLPALLVSIAPRRPQTLAHYLTADGQATLDFLANAFLPVEAQPRFAFDPRLLATDFTLAEDDTVLLGYCTNLHA